MKGSGLSIDRLVHCETILNIPNPPFKNNFGAGKRRGQFDKTNWGLVAFFQEVDRILAPMNLLYQKFVVEGTDFAFDAHVVP